MKVSELIAELQKFDPSLEVEICDGSEGLIYRGSWSFQIWEGRVEIGVGWTRQDGDDD